MTATSADVKAWARDLGFAACGVTTPGPSEHADFLARWLASGYGGTMRYLHRQAKKRKDTRLIDSKARSVVVVLDNYYYQDRTADPDSPDEAGPPGGGLKIARYARGRDYHEVLGERLERLGERLLASGARHVRRYADAGPVPERELAARAGLGWIGKNAMLIRPGVGSWCFIGTIFTDLALEPDTPFRTDHCGSCTRCLDACPTGAFVEPRLLDATRCISYLTIEQKGPIPDDLAASLEGWAFGCDACNDACPWNVKFAEETAVAGYRPQGRPAIGDEDFDALDDAEFERRYAGTPFSRPGLAGMRRNVRAARRSRSGTAS